MILYIFIYLLKKKFFIKLKKLKIISKFGNIPDCIIRNERSERIAYSVITLCTFEFILYKSSKPL